MKKGVTVRRLSPQEMRAVDAHLQGKSQKDALRAAGYSESTIETQAHRFFNRPKIVAEIVRIMGPAMKAPEVLVRLSQKARVSADEQVQVRSLELLGKHHRLFADKVEHDITDSFADLVLGAQRERTAK
jgi:phage terminase small subunit